MRLIPILLGLAALVCGFAFFYKKAFPDIVWPLAWLGPRPVSWESIDFVPLIPWAGFIFIGLGASASLFGTAGTGKGLARRYPWPFRGSSAPARFLSFLGRHSLLAYLVHIPLLFALIWPLSLLFR